MLGRVRDGELNNAAAAKALGISDAAWAAWKSYYLKRTGGGAKRGGLTVVPARRGRPQMAPARPTNPLAGPVAQLEGLRRFGEELRERVRAIEALVEARFPG